MTHDWASLIFLYKMLNFTTTKNPYLFPQHSSLFVFKSLNKKLSPFLSYPIDTSSFKAWHINRLFNSLRPLTSNQSALTVIGPWKSGGAPTLLSGGLMIRADTTPCVYCHWYEHEGADHQEDSVYDKGRRIVTRPVKDPA